MCEQTGKVIRQIAKTIRSGHVRTFRSSLLRKRATKLDESLKVDGQTRKWGMDNEVQKLGQNSEQCFTLWAPTPTSKMSIIFLLLDIGEIWHLFY